MNLQKVDELRAPPVIGQYYLVPCVWYVFGERTQKPHWWPTFGPKHRDAEIIDFDVEHFHHDSRFMSEWQFKKVSTWTSRPAEVNLAGAPLNQMNEARTESVPFGEIVYKRLLCRREMHRFPRGESILENLKTAWVYRLREHYQGQRLIETPQGRVCPHRGVCLDTLHAVDGVLTCPLHGLRFHAETGWALKP